LLWFVLVPSPCPKMKTYGREKDFFFKIDISVGRTVAHLFIHIYRLN
jgi:hypothetical protein